MQKPKHRTIELFSAGIHSYALRCEICGDLRGRYYTLADVLKAGAQHRRDMRQAEKANR